MTQLAAAPNIIDTDTDTDGLTKLLADEITQKIVGFSGSADASRHQVADVITRAIFVNTVTVVYLR